MPHYQDMIVQDTGCNPKDPGMIEHIMREDIFNSTLEWQTRAQFRRAARKAGKMLEEDRDLYEFVAKSDAHRCGTDAPRCCP
jgi:hypothetical protein